MHAKRHGGIRRKIRLKMRRKCRSAHVRIGDGQSKETDSIDDETMVMKCTRANREETDNALMIIGNSNNIAKQAQC